MSVLSRSDPRTDHHPSTGAGLAQTLRFEGVGRTFGTGDAAREVLRDIDLEVDAGSVVALLGASGCGKSTLLREAGGLDAPTGGRITLDGRPVAGIDEPLRRRVPGAAAAAVAHPARQRRVGLPRGIAARRRGEPQVTRAAASWWGWPTSPGCGRVRSPAAWRSARRSPGRWPGDPGVLLLDEPFGALDALTRMKMQDLLLDVHAASATTVLLVTHDVDEALQLADRIVAPRRRAGADPAPASPRSSTCPAPGPATVAGRARRSCAADLLTRLGVDAHRDDTHPCAHPAAGPQAEPR